MYVRKIYRFSESIEIEEYHNGRYGAPGRERQKRQKATPEQIRKQNQYNKEKMVRRLLKKNFHVSDYWITLTYRKENRPADIKAAKKELQKLIRKLRTKYRKKEIELKWIAAIEIGSRGGIHMHLVMNRIQDGDVLLADLWDKGRVYLELLYARGDFRELGSYIAKEPVSQKTEKYYSRSRNLEIPVPEKKIMKRNTFNRTPKKKGYYLDKESYVEGINPVTGYPYRHYTLIKLNRRI